MLINKIYTECKGRYNNNKLIGKCNVCKYPKLCTNNCWDCKDCLYYIHFPDACPPEWPKGRSYDCPYMADFYTCNFSCRFTSEIIYALKCTNLLKADVLKVLSVGCGPCTDLFAVDFLKNRGDIAAKKIEYLGIDGNQYVWEPIHKDIDIYASKAGFTTCFCYADACEAIQGLGKVSWAPNLIVFQYFLSDLNRNNENDPSVVNNFIKSFVQYCENKLQLGAYLILNDINLSAKYKGELHLFNRLEEQPIFSCVRKGHFDNIVDPANPYEQKFFDIKCFPFETIECNDICRSAQMILEKR